MSTTMVMAGRSVHLTTLFPGQAWGNSNMYRRQHVPTTYIQQIRDFTYTGRDACNNKNINDYNKFIRIWNKSTMQTPPAQSCQSFRCSHISSRGMRGQWLSGKALDLRSRGHSFEITGRHFFCSTHEDSKSSQHYCNIVDWYVNHRHKQGHR